MSAFVDPFEELDNKIAAEAAKKQARDRMVALLNKRPMTEADLAEVREARKDPLMEAIFKLKNYYELMKMPQGSLSDAQRAELAGAPEGIAKVYATGKLRAMLVPWELYKELKAKGIGSREDAQMIADIEAKYPEFKQRLLQGKGRRRTGRGRRVRGRRRTTRRR